MRNNCWLTSMALTTCADFAQKLTRKMMTRKTLTQTYIHSQSAPAQIKADKACYTESFEMLGGISTWSIWSRHASIALTLVWHASPGWAVKDANSAYEEGVRQSEEFMENSVYIKTQSLYDKISRNNGLIFFQDSEEGFNIKSVQLSVWSKWKKMVLLQ